MPIGEGAWKKQIYVKFNVKLETMYLKKKQYKLQDFIHPLSQFLLVRTYFYHQALH